MQFQILAISIAILSTSFIRSVPPTNCELYTSADELAQWSRATGEISEAIEKLIQDFELKVRQLRKVQLSLNSITAAKSGAISSHNRSGHAEFMTNPVNAFVTIHRVKQAFDTARVILDTDLFSPADSYAHLIEYGHDYVDSPMRTFIRNLEDESPVNEDLEGTGRALLRLQVFYDLKMSQLIRGNIVTSTRGGIEYSRVDQISPAFMMNDSDTGVLQMDAWDCFELGKLAHHENAHSLAVQWLFKALELIYGEDTEGHLIEDCNPPPEHLISEILDHMAFSAYKLGMIDYSAKLTRAWLDRDPDNERARENLDYYLEMLEANRSPSNEQSVTTNDSTPVELPPSEGIDDYSVTEDQVVRQLCRQSPNELPSSNLSLRCQVLRATPLPWRDVRVEILSENPRVLRIYDIFTVSETEHFRRAAFPLLERSTVSSGAGFRTSNFRIAKSAWLPSERDELVARVEHRLGAILDISMQSAEHFQVVNYGLGGFYGPHLDSARSHKSSDEHSSSLDNDESDIDELSSIGVPINELQRNERLATILIYLNHVRAGGATVFPRLNLSVAPIERSAVVWFNIRPSGHSDGRTLHTGCPVLLGSKWIATKWPRELANSFGRLCKLDMSSL